MQDITQSIVEQRSKKYQTAKVRGPKPYSTKVSYFNKNKIKSLTRHVASIGNTNSQGQKVYIYLFI